MSDIFREVDEEVRRDELKTLWDRYGAYALALCVAIILGVGSYKLWQSYSQSQAEKAGVKYSAAIDLMRAGKSPEALKAFNALATSGTAGYADLAKFQLAASLAKQGKSDQAIKVYDVLTKTDGLDNVLQGLAQTRAGLLLIDSAKFSDIEKRLGSLNAKTNPWRHSAREIMGLSAYKHGDVLKADTYFKAILLDPTAPIGMRRRAQALISLMAPDIAKIAPQKSKLKKPNK